MLFISDDPHRDFDRYDAEQSRLIAMLPKCCECNEPIQDDFCYEINGELICEDCLNEFHRKETEDFVNLEE